MPLLAYEHDIMRTEALFYRSAEEVVPAPSVAHAGFPERWSTATFC